MTSQPFTGKSVSEVITALLFKKTPGQLIIQLTDHCNALCPQCGMRVTENFARSTLSHRDVLRSIDAAAERGVKVVSFTGGEPLLMLDELVGYIRHAGNAGIEFIRTGTNGFLFAHPERPHFKDRIRRVAENLAGTTLRNFWISIDSAIPEVHESMRGFPGLVRGIEKALPIFHECGIYPSANLGINRNIGGEATASATRRPRNPGGAADDGEEFFNAYRKAFRDFYSLAINMGFTIVNACYPMSVECSAPGQSLHAVYAATSRDAIVSFSNPEKIMLFSSLMEAIPEFRPRIRIFTPRTSLYALCEQYEGRQESAYPCRGGLDYFYIDCKDGNAYPCGYRGNENLGSYWNLDAKGLSPSLQCRRCDWECFRDPSELFGPLLHLVSNPFSLVRKIKNDPDYFRLWLCDLRYYRACSLFDGRRPPDYDRMRSSSRMSYIRLGKGLLPRCATRPDARQRLP